MSLPSNSPFEIFQESEKFLKEINPEECTPPFITTVFSSIRNKAFQKLQNDVLNDKKSMLMFISKFEVEYMDVLRSKLLDSYKEFIMTGNQPVSTPISMKEVENFGTHSQLKHFAIIVAELMIELEITTYTIEGLLLYGLVEPEGENSRNYFKKLIHEYAFKKKANSKKCVKSLLRKFINSISPNDESISFNREVSKTKIREKDLVDIILSVANGNKISWQSLTSGLSLTWSLGKCLCGYFLQRLKDFSLRKEMMTRLIDVQETFVSNRIHLMTERRSILDIVERTLEMQDCKNFKKSLNHLVWAAERIFDPQNKRKNFHQYPKVESDAFIIQEEEDIVVIEEKKSKTYADDSIVIVE